MASRMRGSSSVWSSVERPLERSPRLLRHHAVIGEHQRLALPGQPLGRLSEQPDRLSIGIGRIAVALPAHIDRSDHVPSLTLLGMLSAAALRRGRRALRDSGRSQDLAGARQAVGQGGGESRKRYRGRARAAATRRPRRSSPLWRWPVSLEMPADALSLAVCGKQAARDLDTRGLRFLLADQAPRAIALDLAELIAIDR